MSDVYMFQSWTVGCHLCGVDLHFSTAQPAYEFLTQHSCSRELRSKYALTEALDQMGFFDDGDTPDG